MKSTRAMRAGAAAAALLAGGQAIGAEVVWAPMWDQRDQTTWLVKASATTVKFFTENEGSFQVWNAAGTTLLGSGGTGTPVTVAAAVGDSFQMRYTGGFHVRPHWEGVQWARLGPGLQAAGPAGGVGFQSDAELGFDHRWASLPSQFADTTWYFFVAAGERLKLSVEHMTGDVRGSRRFDWIRPDGSAAVADADGMPGSGGAHFVARGGSLGNAPDPASPYWEEYLAPEAASADGWWGFKLTAFDLLGQNPYSWHYVLDRTDPGRDQNAYLRTTSIRDPNQPLPVPASAALVLAGLGAAFSLRRRTRRA